jgi:peroxiredoxin/uncharacterized membrane protein YphA (DoxX/SURF4 family)
MAEILLAARGVLVLVFALAGGAKLLDRRGSPDALRAFGVPAAAAVPLSFALPLVELAVAFALLLGATAWIGAVVALTLLLLFVVGIGVSLARGRRPACHCFGQLHVAPASEATLLRNLALAAVAGLVVWSGPAAVGTSPMSWLSNLSTISVLEALGVIVLLALLVAEGWLSLHLLGQNGRLLLRIEALESRIGPGANAGAATGNGLASSAGAGLPVGVPAPGFSLPSLEGPTVTLDGLGAAGRPVLLVFADPGCGPCAMVLAEIGRWQREETASLTIAVMSRSTPAANRSTREAFGLTHVLLQSDREVAEAYGVRATPSAVLVRPDGRIGSTLLEGGDQIRAFVTQSTGSVEARLVST